MIVKAKQTAFVEVEVDTEGVLEQLINRVLSKARVPHGAWINDKGRMVSDDDSGPGRPWEVDHGEPNAAQRRAIETCEAFEKLVREACKL